MPIHTVPMLYRVLTRQAKRFGKDRDQYYRALSVAAMLTQADSTVSAIEDRAARLLEQLMLMALEHGYVGIEDTIITAAHDLASLTYTRIPWLPAPQNKTLAEPNAQTEEVAEPEPVQHASHSRKPTIADLEPGALLTTKEAALALGRKPNTLLTWASKETGDIQPHCQVGRQHRWLADDIIALLKAKPKRDR